MKNPFKPGDEAYILDKKVSVLASYGYGCSTDIGNIPFELLSFTPYTAEGITHEKPKPKPAGMFWDIDKECGSYGVMTKTIYPIYPYMDETGVPWRNFEEMTFDEYRKLKNL